MAKVKGPLFSFGASGKLGDALVYFPWKGIEVVRTYVIPANPNSAAQQTQRGRLTSAVASWHGAGLDQVDVTAWDRFAATLAKPQSGFNAYVGDHIDIEAGGDTPEPAFDGSLTDDGDGTFSASVEEGGSANAVAMLWGVSATSLINSEAGSETSNVWAFTPADAVAGQTIFARFEVSDAGGVIGTSGIYRLVMA